jgi:adenylate kinase family enzyme
MKTLANCFVTTIKDDNIESIKKRFRTFKETSMPVVEWFGSRGMLRTVSSVQTVEEVWAATKSITTLIFRSCRRWINRSRSANLPNVGSTS